MKLIKDPKILYPVLGAVCALLGTGALLLGMILLWGALCVAANAFFAAGIVCGTESKTVRRSNPMANFSEDEPEEIDVQTFRVPILPALLALLLAVAAGLITKSPLVGLLVLFTWGGVGFPLVACVLGRQEFGLSMQTGLISASVLTGIAGALQVWVSSPGNTFDLKYCYTRLTDVIGNAFSTVFAELSAAAQKEPIPLPDGTSLTDFLSAYSPEEFAKNAVDTLLSVMPSVFAVAVLVLCCATWWGMKAILIRTRNTEVKYMGRIDGYVPGRILPTLYLLFVIANLLTEPGSGFQIAAMNVVTVLSAVLTYAGFSLILYVINTRVRAKVGRIFLILATVAVSVSSCGGSILVLLGLFSAGRDLRKTFGGGTYL